MASKIDRFVEITDPAGIVRRVRVVDAREIEEVKARLAGEAAATPAPAVIEQVIEVDDQSIEPKVSTKSKKG